MDDFYNSEFHRPPYPQPPIPMPPPPQMGGAMGGCACQQNQNGQQGGSPGSDTGAQATPEEEEEGYTKAEKLLIIMRHMVNTSDAIISELPDSLPRITSGKDRGNETLSLTVTVK